MPKLVYVLKGARNVNYKEIRQTDRVLDEASRLYSISMLKWLSIKWRVPARV